MIVEISAFKTKIGETSGDKTMVGETSGDKTMIGETSGDKTMIGETSGDKTMIGETSGDKTMIGETSGDETMIEETSENEEYGQELGLHIYRINIWTLWTAGYILDVSKFTVIRSKLTRSLLKGASAIMFCYHFIVFYVCFIRLILSYEQQDFPARCMEFFAVLNDIILGTLCHCKTEVLCKLVRDMESVQPREYYYPLKRISKLLYFVLVAIPVFVFLLTVVQVAVSDYYLQHFYDGVFFMLNIVVRGRYILFFRICACCISYLAFVNVSLPMLAMLATTLTLFVQLKFRYQYAMNNGSYDSADELKKTRKLLSEIEYSMIQINDFSSILFLYSVTTFMVVVCVSVVHFFSDYPIAPGFTYNCSVLLTSGYSVAYVVCLIAILYCIDDKSLYNKIIKVYEISAEIDPSDTEYAIQAEMLAKQIDATRIHARLWKFSKVKRMSIIDMTTTFWSYFLLVLRTDTNAWNFVMRTDSDD